MERKETLTMRGHKDEKKRGNKKTEMKRILPTIHHTTFMYAKTR